MINTDNKINLDGFTKKELIEMKKEYESNKGSKKILPLINAFIYKKSLEEAAIEGEKLNRACTFESNSVLPIDIIPEDKRNILYYNNIRNVQELIDADIDRLVTEDNCAIGKEAKEYFYWAKRMYDMRTIVEAESSTGIDKRLVKGKKTTAAATNKNN